MKEGKVSMDEDKNLEVIYDETERANIAESFQSQEKENPNFNVGEHIKHIAEIRSK